MAGPVQNDTAFRAETPEGIEYTLYPAGICPRFCAYALDSVFQWILLMAFMLIYGLALRAAAGFWLIMLVRFGMDWFYHVICELLFRGQTPGKRILGLRVVQGDGSPVEAGSSFIRNLLRFVDSFLGLYLIAFLSTVASRGFRRPGDWAAGTLVIYTWQSRLSPRTSMDWLDRSDLVQAVPAFQTRPLSFEEKQGILTFARRYPLLGPARADEIAAPLAASLTKNAGLPPAAAGDEAGTGNGGNDAGNDAGTGGAGAGLSPSAFLLNIARSFAGTESAGATGAAGPAGTDGARPEAGP
jgi:uncharacterized RDD family membrane protein YckC